jgi:hypothetical protein
MPIQGRALPSAMMERPEGKQVMGASASPFTERERNALEGLDVDKLNDLAECIFVLNNRRYGPIPGAYMVMCVKPNEEWCVAQLNADRARPFILFEEKIFPSAELAQEEAERIKIARGELAPPRRCT